MLFKAQMPLFLAELLLETVFFFKLHVIMNKAFAQNTKTFMNDV